MRFVLTLMLFCCWTIGAQAQDFRSCFAQAAARYQVPEILLVAIARVESNFNPSAQHINAHLRRPSEDVGIMQVNSWWFPRLAQFGLTREHLFDACTNIHVGAWILAHNFKERGFSWQAVGAYNAAKDPQKQAAYARKVWRAAGLQ